MSGNRVLEKLIILDYLLDRSEWGVRELSWETGFSIDKVKSVLKDLSKNYLIELDSSKVIWNPADNPSTLKPWGWRLIHKLVVGSTQEVAKGYGPWSIVVSEYQIMGRGRYGRKWFSSLGGLWFTLSLSLNSSEASLLPIAVPVILTKVLNKQFNVETRIKWPNDIVVKEGKLAGILVEAEAFPDKFIVYVGVGVNVNNEPRLEEAVSLKHLLGGLVPRNKLLATVVGWFSNIRRVLEDRERLVRDYMDSLDTLHRRVVLDTVDGVVEGVVVNVRSDGAIVLETESGEVVYEPSSVYRVRYVEET